jgi:hypothetical protein
MHKWFVDGKKFQLKKWSHGVSEIRPKLQMPKLPTDEYPGHYADKCNQEDRIKYNQEENATKSVNCPKNDRNKHGSLENPSPQKGCNGNVIEPRAATNARHENGYVVSNTNKKDIDGSPPLKEK